MRLLLDTCTFLWIASGSDALSGPARELFADPANEVFLSAVSGWEIAVKHRLGKLPLPAEPAVFVPEQRQGHRVTELPLEEAAALTLDRLPDAHCDPFDRMLVCQAIQHGLTILTPDPLVRQYPVRCVW